MKSILLQTIALCVMILPLTELKAATPGGLKAGTTFNLTVTTRSSIKRSQFATDTSAPIPSGIPNFKKGQTVKFTIGTNGQLKADLMSIPIVLADSRSNMYYLRRSSNGSSTMSNGQLTKTNNVPETLVLSFSKTSGSGFQTVVQVISYVLE